MDDLKVVVKVGGSLFDWPGLGQRLEHWLKTLPSSWVLLVPGGGPTVDVIRNFERQHGLGEESAHWLALRALSVSAHFLAAVLSLRRSPRPAVIADLQDADAIWSQRGLPILDPFRFAQEDEDRPGRLPHSWSVTSDSLAARVAMRFQAQKLILLKSTDIPNDWMKAERGIVDPYFEEIIRTDSQAIGSTLEVSALNFRGWRG
jgi:aspartokinase-like uncharacterized kinase